VNPTPAAPAAAAMDGTQRFFITLASVLATT
jgi:hypothetical protein